jgi:release factor glutamine methyltransferase
MLTFVRRRTTREDQASMFGLSLRVPPTVFHPRLFRSSRFLGQHIMGKDVRTKTLLDVGCGSGILSLIAARGGADVTSVDINPKAVEAALINAAANGLGGKMRVVQSNLFEMVPPGERFDIIVWNPPFYPEEPTDDASRAWKAGGAYRVIEQFADSGGSYLGQGGAIIVVLSSDVNVQMILSFFTPRQWSATLVSSRRFLFETLSIYEFRRI